jgi:hypothetical protein
MQALHWRRTQPRRPSSSECENVLYLSDAAAALNFKFNSEELHSITVSITLYTEVKRCQTIQCHSAHHLAAA